ncbi:MAG: amino acid permease [Candidatus Micrarchaeota archaeon]
MKLKRELGLFSTTLYGIGVILGAGIYALIGVGAGLAGNMLWLAFLAAALVAVFTGLSYAELSSMFPKEAAEYNYTRKAFGKELFSFIIGWLLVVGILIAASTVALGFAGYFSSLFGGQLTLIAALVIAATTIMNYLGIRESANFNNFSSILEALGLVIVIAIGFLLPPASDFDLFIPPADGFAGVMAAVSVIFFAYIGFESITNLSEEVKDSRNTVPKALVLALGISTLLYVLVAIAAVREVGWEALSQSKAPLALVTERALGSYSAALSLIALFATSNTVLIFLIVSSRILYGMSRGGSIHPIFSVVGMRGTPYVSVIAVGAAAALCAAVFDIKTVAQLSDMSVFIAYFAVNASLIALSGKAISRRFRSPRVLGIPVFAYLGAASSLLMLAFFDAGIWLLEAVILAAGLLLFFIAKALARGPGG